MAAGTDGSPPIGARERDDAVRRLQEAYTAGKLSDEELDARLHTALTATAPGELVSALAALPEPPREGAVTITGDGVGGRIRRRGAWTVPRALTLASALGRAHLDLSRAVIAHPVVDIELQLGTGGARITVPRNAVVDLSGLHTGMRAARYRPRRAARPDAPTIRISGVMGTGRLRIRHARW
ncbi:DUF1707 domain-containing protein [Kitasatospora sp. NPDC017646]|uniref:DUF1707 domain-containing protein n=1 Tax=Kitasatospora sp. NPDC017646 TaxID=3364024 RepID=UPI0037BDC88D